jgi:hypothetical protein
MTLRVNLPTAIYPAPANLSRFWHEAEEILAAIPGVTSATAMYGLPPQRPIDANDRDIENFTMVPGGPGKISITINSPATISSKPWVFASSTGGCPMRAT